MERYSSNEFLYRQLSSLFHQPITESSFSPVGGGSINETFRLKLSDNNIFFCKINSASKFPHLFQKEKAGLEIISKTGSIKTPEVIDHFIADDQQVLVLEWIQEGERNKSFWIKFGEQLAALHNVSGEYFGLHENNFMGSVQQLNNLSKKWVSFFIDYRLRPLVNECFQVHLLAAGDVESFENLYARLPQIFDEEEPALLHGDLWSGNIMCNKWSQPVLIDPAVYFGHRSVDLAMTTLFGGFDKSFYEAYQYHSPFPSNYREQWEVCNLYPLLIHLLLFGKSYLHQVTATLKKYQ